MPTTTTTVPRFAATISDAVKLKAFSLAHAGGDVDHPHSTMFGFSESVRLGVDMLDTDVQLTKDNVLIVQHDDTVDGTTQASGKVAEITFDALKKLDNAYRFVPGCWPCAGRPDADYAYRGIRTGSKPAPVGYTAEDFRIISFEELIVKFPDALFDIEIKGSGASAFPAAKELARLLDKYNKNAQAVVVSFDDTVVDEFHRIAPSVATSPGLKALSAYVLSKTPLDSSQRIIQIPPMYGTIKVLTKELVDRAHADRLTVWVWPDDNKLENASYYRSLLAYGIDGVDASKPEAMVGVTKEVRDN